MSIICSLCRAGVSEEELWEHVESLHVGPMDRARLFCGSCVFRVPETRMDMLANHCLITGHNPARIRTDWRKEQERTMKIFGIIYGMKRGTPYASQQARVAAETLPDSTFPDKTVLQRALETDGEASSDSTDARFQGRMDGIRAPLPPPYAFPPTPILPGNLPFPPPGFHPFPSATPLTTANDDSTSIPVSSSEGAVTETTATEPNNFPAISLSYEEEEESSGKEEESEMSFGAEGPTLEFDDFGNFSYQNAESSRDAESEAGIVSVFRNSNDATGSGVVHDPLEASLEDHSRKMLELYGAASGHPHASGRSAFSEGQNLSETQRTAMEAQKEFFSDIAASGKDAASKLGTSSGLYTCPTVECKLCNMSFVAYSKKHANARPLLKMRFLTMHIVSRHMKDIKPFSCSSCGFSAGRKDGVVKHIRRNCTSHEKDDKPQLVYNGISQEAQERLKLLLPQAFPGFDFSRRNQLAGYLPGVGTTGLDGDEADDDADESVNEELPLPVSTQ